MFEWNKVIQEMFITEVEVECSRCGAEFEVAKSEAQTKKIFICPACAKKVIEKYKRRMKERKGRGADSPYLEPAFA